MIPVEKKCIRCGVVKPVESFRFQRGPDSPRANVCRDCRNEWDAAYRKKNRARILGYFRQRRIAFGAELLARQRRYSKTPRARRWNAEYQRVYQKLPAVRERIRARKRRYYQRVLKNDPRIRLITGIRNRFNLALKRAGVEKMTGALVLVGCSRSELLAHFEKLFQPGMSWENRGLKGWHVDHIRPCASFDLTDPEQQKVCFHYTNLQPLWAKENLTKSAKWTPGGIRGDLPALELVQSGLGNVQTPAHPGEPKPAGLPPVIGGASADPNPAAKSREGYRTPIHITEGAA